MTKSEAKTASISTIGRTVRYPLGATALNPKQCKEVDSTWKTHVLGKMGVVRTAPKEVIYSPTQFGGIGLHSTGIDQMIDHVKMILNHGHTQSVTGKLIRHSLQHMTVEMGMQGCPFKVDLTKVEYLTENTWIENTLRSCQQNNINIENKETCLQQWIETDDFIMNRAVNILSKKGARSYVPRRSHIVRYNDGRWEKYRYRYFIR